MGVPYRQVEGALDDASTELFGDRSIRSVGIGRNGDQFGFFVVRHDARIVPQAGMVSVGASKTPRPLNAAIAGVPHHRPGRSARPSCSLEVAVEWTRLTHRGVVGDRATIPDGRSVTDYRSRISTTTSDRESCRWKHPHLYAGNGTQTYACPMDTVLAKLKCTLI